MAVHYYDGSGLPLTPDADVVRFFQEDGSPDFATETIRYTTPSDVAWVVLEFGASRNGLPGTITLDIAYVR